MRGRDGKTRQTFNNSLPFYAFFTFTSAMSLPSYLSVSVSLSDPALFLSISIHFSCFLALLYFILSFCSCSNLIFILQDCPISCFCFSWNLYLAIPLSLSLLIIIYLCVYAPIYISTWKHYSHWRELEALSLKRWCLIDDGRMQTRWVWLQFKKMYLSI